MKIGIDISQLAYENTGVAQYLGNLIQNLLKIDKENEYILFFSAFRKKSKFSIFNFQSNPNVIVKQFRIPTTILDLLWNKLHIVPIENFIGDVDIFVTSDWTEPPTKRAKKATILYDLIVHTKPKETDNKIVQTQKQKLNWVKKESNIVFCISEATRKDAINILGIDNEKIKVIYPST